MQHLGGRVADHVGRGLVDVDQLVLLNHAYAHLGLIHEDLVLGLGLGELVLRGALGGDVAHRRNAGGASLVAERAGAHFRLKGGPVLAQPHEPECMIPPGGHLPPHLVEGLRGREPQGGLAHELLLLIPEQLDYGLVDYAYDPRLVDDDAAEGDVEQGLKLGHLVSGIRARSRDSAQLIAQDRGPPVGQAPGLHDQPNGFSFEAHGLPPAALHHPGTLLGSFFPDPTEFGPKNVHR